jgi:hypothetical protein
MFFLKQKFVHPNTLTLSLTLTLMWHATRPPLLRRIFIITLGLKQPNKEFDITFLLKNFSCMSLFNIQFLIGSETFNLQLTVTPTTIPFLLSPHTSLDWPTNLSIIVTMNHTLEEQITYFFNWRGTYHMKTMWRFVSL